MFSFAHPWFLLLLLPAAAAARIVFRRGKFGGILFAPTRRLPARGATWRTRAANATPALFVAGLVLAVAALARPQTVLSRTRHAAGAVAIEMVLDVSGSMRALDMSDFAGNRIVKERSRLDAVKEVFARFVAKRPDDLIGLVTFGGYASSRVPLTADHDAMLHVLKGVEIPRSSFDRNGTIVNQDELLTAIGDAVATACARLKDAEPKSRVMILLSDGEQTVDDPRTVQPLEAMNAAKKLGIKMYTVGVGSTGEAPFWGVDIFGRKTLMVQNVAMDEALLGKMAETTGGRYFNVRDPRGLDEALAEIDRLEKTKVQRDVYRHCNEFFPWFLWPAVGLIVLGTSLGMAITRRIV